MTRDELETAILKAKDLGSVEKECNEWFSKHHDKNYLTKGLNSNEFTFPALKEELLVSRALRAGYLELNPIPVNNFMNEAALKALLAFFEARARVSAGAETAFWSMHIDALRAAMSKRGIKVL